jgi:magnesium-transporting ATPase (P-type)
MQKQWHEIKMGALLKVVKDTEFPADMLLLKSSRDNGVVFVETLNLDGESAMK